MLARVWYNGYRFTRKTLQISRREELDSNEAEFEQQLADLNNSHQSKLDKVNKPDGYSELTKPPPGVVILHQAICCLSIYAL